MNVYKASIKVFLINCVFKYLFQVLNDIRENINLPSDVIESPVKSQRSLLSRSQNVNKAKSSQIIDHKILLFSNIKMAFLVHKYITTAWLKVRF